MFRKTAIAIFILLFAHTVIAQQEAKVRSAAEMFHATVKGKNNFIPDKIILKLEPLHYHSKMHG